MKAFTDLNQSKKLAEILPIESADMWWNFYSVTTDNTTPQIIHLDTPWVGNFNWDNKSDNVPCWSLAALLEELNRNCWNVSLKCCGAEWDMTYDDRERYISISSDYAIDACVAMIEKLHELKML